MKKQAASDSKNSGLGQSAKASQPASNAQSMPQTSKQTGKPAAAAKPDSVSIPLPSKVIRDIIAWTVRYVDYRNFDSFIQDEKGGDSLKDSVPLILLAQCISDAPDSVDQLGSPGHVDLRPKLTDEHIESIAFNVAVMAPRGFNHAGTRNHAACIPHEQL